MKYEAKQESGDDTYCPISNTACLQTSGAWTKGNIKSQSNGLPIRYLNQYSTIVACQSIGAHLITNNEWMAIARNIETQSSNWSTNTVGSGYIYSGHNNNSPTTAIIASVNDSDGYINTFDNSGSGATQKRNIVISNGQVIWDLSGNVWEHVNKANTLNGSGYATNKTSITGCGDPASWSEWLTCSDKTFGTSNINWGSNQGVGGVWYGQGEADNVFLRGGAWHNGAYTGIFIITLHWKALNSDSNVGFRCAK